VCAQPTTSSATALNAASRAAAEDIESAPSRFAD
jgi:hypothetical protein